MHILEQRFDEGVDPKPLSAKPAEGAVHEQYAVMRYARAGKRLGDYLRLGGHTGFLGPR